MTLKQKLVKLLGPDAVRDDADTLAQHSRDRWFASHRPDAVVFGESAEQVSRLLKFANRHGIPVTARGAGVGYVGSCVPLRGGIALSLARMNRIKEIHPEDFVAVVQPGVITAALQTAVEKLGRYYPPDPASRADCTIGGNIAT